MNFSGCFFTYAFVYVNVGRFKANGNKTEWLLQSCAA